MRDKVSIPRLKNTGLIREFEDKHERSPRPS